MRRALAVLLLAVIGSSPITPLLLANPRAELPACCRRDGKHGCVRAPMVDEGSPASPAISAFQPKCSSFPRPGVLPAGPKSCVEATASRRGPADSIQFQVFRLNRGPLKVGVHDSVQKRGPPPTLS